MTDYTSILTASEIEKYSQMLLDEFISISDEVDRQVHFLQKGKHAFQINRTFRMFLKLYGKFENLSTNELELLEDIDLFGVLHVEPEEVRDDKLLESAIETKKLLLQFHEYLSKNVIKQNAERDQLQVLKIKDEVSNLTESSTSDLANALNDIVKRSSSTTANYNSLLDLIKNEFNTMVYLLSDRKLTFSDLVDMHTKALMLLEKLFSVLETKQHYEDLWVSAKAFEQDPIQFYDIVDDISSIGFIAPKKDDLQILLQQLAKGTFFVENTNNEIILKDEYKQLLKRSITKLFDDFVSNKEIELRLEFLNLLPEAFIVSLTNIDQIYDLFKGIEEKAVLLNSTAEVEIGSIVIRKVPTFENLFRELLSNSENLQEKYLKVNLAFLETTRSINKLLESNDKDSNVLKVLLEILQRIQLAVSLTLIDQTDVFSAANGEKSLFEFIQVFGTTFRLLYESFMGNLDLLASNFSHKSEGNVDEITKAIVNRVEAHANVKYLILKNFINLDEQSYVNIRRSRDDNLLTIVRRQRDTGRPFSDHQRYIRDFLYHITESDLYLPSADDLTVYLSLREETVGELVALMKKISEVVIKQYNELIAKIREKGINDITSITLANITDSDGEEIQVKYHNLLKAIGQLQLLGFVFSASSIDNNFQLDLNEDILTTYLKGYI